MGKLHNVVTEARKRNHYLETVILPELKAERTRQFETWGFQSHPMGNVFTREDADAMRKLTDEAAKDGRLTWRHIAVEELYEAFSADHPEEVREELIQLLAVVAAVIQHIDTAEGA